MTDEQLESRSLGLSEEDKGMKASGIARAWHTHMANLRATYHRLTAADPARKDPQIDALFDPDKWGNNTNWAIPNQIEILLTRLYPVEEIAAEFERQASRAERINVPSLARLRKMEEAAAAAEEKRPVLVALLREVHSRHATQRSEQVARKLAAKRLLWIGVCLAAIFALTLWVVGHWQAQSLLMEYHLFVTTFFGVLGALLSRLIAFQNSAASLKVDELEDGYSFWFLTVRLLVGGFSSVMIYMVIAGGLLAGELFPKGDLGGFGALWKEYDVSGQKYSAPSPDFAKLIVWCFIAGFSERFLPDQLGSLNKNVETA
jgi:hypothetical protein